MAAVIRYFDLVREMKNAYNHRLRLVESAKQRGVKPQEDTMCPGFPTRSLESLSRTGVSIVRYGNSQFERYKVSLCVWPSSESFMTAD